MRIGVLGGGQLGRMLALAGIPLGLRFRFWEPTTDAPASDVGEIFSYSFDDHSKIEAFVADLDCITYEFENVPAALVDALRNFCPVFPSKEALEICQDRIFEKSTFSELGIPCANFRQIGSLQELESALNAGFSLPAILKTRRMGYDGKGQVRLESSSNAHAAWMKLGQQPAILEECVPFEAEVSLLGVRGRSGAVAFYPLIENRHRNGILHSSYAPSSLVTAELQALAEGYGSKLLEHFNYIGLLTIEFFLRDGQLYANEMAPRVHNSGHWTIEGCDTSQFENHIRAVAGFPLGSTKVRGTSVLLNLVGENPPRELVLGTDFAHLHLYRKSGRRQRKIGHITINHCNQAVVHETALQLDNDLRSYQQFEPS